MDKKLTEEQYEALKPYERNIKAAYRNSFVHMSGSDFIKVSKIYNEIFPPLTKGQTGCNTCRLNALRKLGELYENYTKEIAEIETTVEIVEKVEKKNKKGAGRPKKLNK